MGTWCLIRLDWPIRLQLRFLQHPTRTHPEVWHRRVSNAMASTSRRKHTFDLRFRFNISHHTDQQFYLRTEHFLKMGGNLLSTTCHVIFPRVPRNTFSWSNEIKGHLSFLQNQWSGNTTMKLGKYRHVNWERHENVSQCIKQRVSKLTTNQCANRRNPSELTRA